jgi:nitrous oxide reductase accessory protein NosL
MNSNTMRHLLLLTCVAALFVGCDSEGDRCRKCGMLVDQAPRWIAGLTNSAGMPERFCCERCMFAHLRGPQGPGSRDAWVTEYYSQKRMPVEDVLFVSGSDVTGPMGKALVPVAGRAAAEQFLKDHHGTRILSADEITTEVLREIAGNPRKPSAQ